MVNEAETEAKMPKAWRVTMFSQGCEASIGDERQPTDTILGRARCKSGWGEYLEYFLDAVVDDEEDEDTLAAENEVVADANVTQELHRAERPRWDGASRWRILDRKTEAA